MIDTNDDGTRAMMQLRRATATKTLLSAAGIAGISAWWIKHGLDERGDAFMIWGPGGIGLAIAAAIAIAGVVMFTTRPKAVD
jgi:hypothetical protein